LSFNWPFLNFQGVSQGSVGTAPWPLTVTNSSSQPLTNLSYAFTGVTNYVAGAFSIVDTNNCFGATLNAGASCTFNVVPSPNSAQPLGSYSATLTVSGTGTSGTLSSYALPVSGVVNVGGLSINWNQDQQTASDGSGLTYSTLDFGAQNAVGVQSGPWPITVYNNTPSVQTLTLTPSLPVFTTDSSTCSNVAAGASCSFNLYFTPSAAQTYQGTLTISGSACTYSFNTWGQGQE